jgi:hypothetical protein
VGGIAVALEDVEIEALSAAVLMSTGFVSACF